MNFGCQDLIESTSALQVCSPMDLEGFTRLSEKDQKSKDPYFGGGGVIPTLISSLVRLGPCHVAF